MYIHATWNAFAGFRSRRRNIDNPPASKQSESDSKDHSPDQHDNELHDIPDKETMDEAITDFLRRFEKDLPGSGPMESKGIRKVYDPSPTPILYVGPISNVLGRVPLMPLFLHGNSTPTIPHQLRHLQRSKFPLGCAQADASNKSGRKGSNVHELNQWMWEFGRGKPCLGGLSDSISHRDWSPGASNRCEEGGM